MHVYMHTYIPVLPVSCSLNRPATVRVRDTFPAPAAPSPSDDSAYMPRPCLSRCKMRGSFTADMPLGDGAVCMCVCVCMYMSC